MENKEKEYAPGMRVIIHDEEWIIKAHPVRSYRMSLKKTRFILLKHKERLDPSKNEPQRLEKALRLNDRLSKMYYLKEDLYQLWSQTDKQSARKFAED